MKVTRGSPRVGAQAVRLPSSSPLKTPTSNRQGTVEPMTFDPFAILGVPRRFDVDAAQVHRAYLMRSATLHPDLGEAPGPAGDDSAALNRAKAILDDPEQRADTLLILLGGPTREAERALPDGFLMEIMDTRERLDEALRTGDRAAAAAFEEWAFTQRAAHIAAARERFEQLSSPPAPAALRDIRRELNAWRYIERMLEQLRDGSPL